MTSEIRAALQAAVNQIDGDWRVSHHCSVVGIERLTADGELETKPVILYPQGQAAYITGGLLVKGMDLLGDE